MDIFLVRHGEAAASWGESADPGLSDLGRKQAEAAASVLQETLQALNSESTTLLSSPLARAQETAKPLAQLRQCSVTVDKRFSEVPSPVPQAQRQDWLRGFMAQRWEDQPSELRKWKQDALAGLRSLESPAVVFTHFLLINAVVGELQARAETLCFWPDNASITHLRKEGGQLSLVALGDEIKTHVN